MSHANCPHNCLPRVVRTATSAAVWTIQSTSLFFPVCHFEQNVISLTPDIRWNPNELCWVRNDEAYALVQFEVIPSTLNLSILALMAASLDGCSGCCF
jgi:hypothetical protein